MKQLEAEAAAYEKEESQKKELRLVFGKLKEAWFKAG